jgi:hypothetical protein
MRVTLLVSVLSLLLASAWILGFGLLCATPVMSCNAVPLNELTQYWVALFLLGGLAVGAAIVVITFDLIVILLLPGLRASVLTLAFIGGVTSCLPKAIYELSFDQWMLGVIPTIHAVPLALPGAVVMLLLSRLLNNRCSGACWSRTLR